jgi:anti-sigma B factor antagonist
MTDSCEVSVRQLGEDTVVLELHGVVNGDAARVLGPTYDAAVTAGQPRHVVLDFTDVEYINSTGIALVVSVLGKARASGRTIGAAGLSEHYRHIFTITRLSDFMDLYADVDAAVSGLAAAQA